MAITTSNLLTGLITPAQRDEQLRQQGIQNASVSPGRMAQVHAATYADRATNSLSSLFGIDTSTPEERVAGAFSNLDINKPDDQATALQILKDEGMFQKAAQLQEQIDLENVRLAAQTKTETAAAAVITAQKDAVMGIYPDKPELTAVMSSLIDAGVNFADVMALGKEPEAASMNKEQMIAWYMERGYGAAQAAAIVTEAFREKTPTESKDWVAPTTAQLNAATAQIEFLSDTDDLMAWRNITTLEALGAEVAYIQANFPGESIEQVTSRAIDFYVKAKGWTHSAEPGDFQRAEEASRGGNTNTDTGSTGVAEAYADYVEG